jgi:Fic family protein
MRDFWFCASAAPCYLLNVMDELPASIAAKKERLDEVRPLSGKALAALEHYYDVELTYTSNAIEGNTLTQIETSIVIEKGITVSGKPLKDHLEAVDHYNALRYARDLAQQDTALTEGDVRNLHKLIVQRSDPEIAGRYADGVRYTPTETGRHTFPTPAEVPPLMSDFAAWLRTAPNTPETAFTAHRRLVDIHPFNDGNGRTARLLMNLVLIRGGYPPVAVRPEDRLEYIRSLAQEQAGQGADRFSQLLYKRLDATLGEYLSALQEALPPEFKRDKPGGPDPKP